MSVTVDENSARARIAQLVAAGAAAAAVFDAVVEETKRLLDVPAAALARYEPDAAASVLAGDWPRDGDRVAAVVHEQHGPAQTESAVGVPVTIDGSLWGVLTAGRDVLPHDALERLSDFGQLAGTALASAVATERARRLADGQVALRRLATLISGGAPAAELFSAVVEEVRSVLAVPAIALLRYEPERATTTVASIDAPMFPVGVRLSLDGPSVSAAVLDSGRPARIDDYEGLEGSIAPRVRGSGIRSVVGAPIVVEGRVWGLICVGSRERLPAGIETELQDFTNLVAIAIASVEARARPRRLAEQQASLRRVATLVAEGAAPAALFSAVAEEVARILDVSAVSIFRFEYDRTSVVVASVKDPVFAVGSRWPLDSPSLNAMVFATGRPARIDDYSGLDGPIAVSTQASGIESGVGVPIVVDGSVWGMVAVGRRRRRDVLPSFTGSYTGRLLLSQESSQEIETRLAAFTELVATAISQAQANDDVRLLAEEQAALRRVATLAAEGASPQDIFATVAREVADILGLPRVEMVRYERDGTGTVIGASGNHPFPVGSNWALDGPSVMATVLETGDKARIDDYSVLRGTIAEVADRAGFRSAIGAPIVVGGATWGAIIAISTEHEPIPERSEVRLSQFTELVATAVSNATARADLIASRARIVAAGDEARRRLERNLHDGLQQRLIALGIDLQRIHASIPAEYRAPRASLEQAEHDAGSMLEEVRELSRGLHPPLLSRGGLGPALAVLARKSPIPVDLDVDVEERPPSTVETAVYYTMSEALTNAVKHSRASAISVQVQRRGDVVRARVTDDGVGGAVLGTGSGLVGLDDRVKALGGRFVVESSEEQGTAVSIELPTTTPATP
ncbi:MAG TPA: GAF domain-containing sensor histidine kinase [Solirubrobacteraceae bacterium]